MTGEPRRWGAGRTMLVVVAVWWFPCAGLLSAQSQASATGASRAACEELRGASFADALQGKIPGVNVIRSGGASGSSATVRIRGVHTLAGNSPLIYLDGIRIAELRSGNLYAIPLLEVVDPLHVDRIEVIRGPEATFRYGRDASSGVIHVHTRRAGDTRSDPPGCP